MTSVDYPLLVVLRFLNIAIDNRRDFTHIQTIFMLLNQARAILWPAHAWFLKIDPVRIIGMRVCVCVCVSTPEAINN